MRHWRECGTAKKTAIWIPAVLAKAASGNGGEAWSSPDRGGNNSCPREAVAHPTRFVTMNFESGVIIRIPQLNEISPVSPGVN